MVSGGVASVSDFGCYLRGKRGRVGGIVVGIRVRRGGDICDTVLKRWRRGNGLFYG